jgi:hypothetical protein
MTMTRHTVSIALAVALTTVGCSREPEVEKVAVGSDVQLTRQDGGVVEGKLTARDDKTVQVASGKTTKTVPKAEIADVKVVPEGGKAPELPAIAKFREYTVPGGTKLALELETALNTETAKVEDTVEARLTEAVTVDGAEVLPVGARVRGAVSAVQPAGKVKGRASLAVTFTRLTARDENYPIAGDFSLLAPATKGEDAKKIGIGAGAGAIVGAIIGGKKGAAVGAVVGGGAGATHVMMTAGKEIDLPRGTNIAVTLDRAIDVRVPVR